MVVVVALAAAVDCRNAPGRRKGGHGTGAGRP